MITRIPDEIEESLEAHKADLNALEISDQAATAFIVHTKLNQPSQSRQQNTNIHSNETPSTNIPRIPFTCNNCGRNGHSVARCYAAGGGLEGQAPWMKNKGPTHVVPHISSNPPNRIINNPRPPVATA